MSKPIVTKLLAALTGAMLLAGTVVAGVSAPVIQVQAADVSLTQALRNSFDPVFYSNKYADLKAAFGTDANALFNHFTTHGMTEGRMMNVNFDPKAYIVAYADVADYCKGDYRKAYEHYVLHGIAEGRKLTTSDAINKKWADEAKAEENKNNNNNNNDDKKDHRCPYNWCFDPWCNHWRDWDWHPTGFCPDPFPIIVEPDPFPGFIPPMPGPDPFIPACGPCFPPMPMPGPGPVCPF